MIYWTLAILESLYFSLLYAVPPLKYYNLFYLWNFDYGNPYHATYLLSRFKSPYLLTRGVHLWADHQKYFSVLLAPLHYFPAPHYALLITHSLAIWACGFFCMAFWRRIKTLSLLIPLVVWLSPFMVNMNLDLYHEEAFATIFLLLTFLSAWEGWRKGFYLFLILAISCKEDVAITAGLFMLLALVRPQLFRLSHREFTAGLLLCAFLFLVNEKIVLPYYKLKTCEWLDHGFSAHLVSSSPTAPWFSSIYEDLFKPPFLRQHIFNRDVARYLLLLFWPTFLFLRSSFPFCLLPLPGALINVLGGAYLIQGYWHYDHSSFAAVLIAVLIGLDKARWKKSLSLILAIIMLGINLKRPSIRTRVTEPFTRSFWQIKKVPQVRFLEDLRKRLPWDVVISADYISLNYLLEGHEHVYMFRNPFGREYFGIYGLCEDPTSLPKPDLVLLRAGYHVDAQTQALLKESYEHNRIHDAATSAEFDIYLYSKSLLHERLNSIFGTSG
jgi:uncharacterized membrane protein